MKLTVALSLSLLTTGSAFAPIAMKKTALTFSSPAVMFMQDTTAAVEEAMEASETYGKASPEARAAWGLVEELDAANSHEKARLQQLEKKKAELEKLIEDKVEAPTLHEDTSELVKKALMMSRVYGKTSVEAKMAWEAVEEKMDAANSHHRPADIHTAKNAKVEVAPPAPEKKEKMKIVETNPETIDEAIAKAMFINQVYGAHSTEARLAWEIVEELDAATSHKKSQTQAETKPAVEEKIETTIPAQTVHVDSQEAVKAALEASKKFGASSKEARLAWETVEEINATNSHHKAVGSG
mmetsp:Transcript_2599/g.5624  ORF Transcript_2599/g.5624 Transcript_2599/m.5624 type:complete len:297 (+) Transcript_2599:125-1015(+)|eukprot:CAMPEP_0113466854 /NCGR_PEP_ID=MMETSP0014_2-20120614/14496_1 /TAXON_ID=2857 /ORGANISM="Nitzschia sp." /LENGTH=296 /DNA_ID=CAMNT_0000359109 /DNA_START=122 /DNA_END=1012 /DNA_ORIENTATION=+ /assembly_acc=CAM_ASM_000159